MKVLSNPSDTDKFSRTKRRHIQTHNPHQHNQRHERGKFCYFTPEKKVSRRRKNDFTTKRKRLESQNGEGKFYVSIALYGQYLDAGMRMERSSHRQFKSSLLFVSNTQKTSCKKPSHPLSHQHTYLGR